MNVHKIILYTTHCPKCDVLTSKMNQKNIQYEEVTDLQVMESKGFDTVPMLEVDGVVMNFKDANTWINNQEA